MERPAFHDSDAHEATARTKRPAAMNGTSGCFQIDMIDS